MRFAWIAAMALAATPGLAFEAEDQTPTGKFLTATEVRMILDATKANWVAVRDWNGQDWVYFTQILSWRCGLHQLRYSINGGEMQVFEMPPCYVDEPQPAAIKENDIIYVTFPPGEVQSVEIELLYDDLGEDRAEFDRASVLIP